VEKLVASKNYKVIPIEIPFVEEGRIVHAMTMLTAASTVLPDTRGISAPIRTMLALGRATPSTDYLLAQKLRAVMMNHLAWLWKTYPSMVIVTPTTACAGWRIRKASELKYGISGGNRTEESIEYVWMASFCGVPSITLPAGFVVPEGQPHEGEIAEPDTAGKIPVDLMATAEWGNEAALMKFGSDVEFCAGRPSLVPSWLDAIELARQEMGSEAIA
jgi:Asp-tRNA(Asn)/Glu-tRNA(Gln) amidotransferase A subunit family amidase